LSQSHKLPEPPASAVKIARWIVGIGVVVAATAWTLTNLGALHTAWCTSGFWNCSQASPSATGKGRAVKGVWRLTMGGVEEMRRAATIAGASLCAIAVVPALAEGCADRLADNSPVNDVIACIKEQQDTIASLRQNLSIWSSDAPAPGNEVGSGDSKPPTMCPKNYYAVGINWWGSGSTTRYCVGCLSGIQVVCAKLNTQ
jgi:hypothetical protein